MRILVTGATGFIGQHLVVELVKSGYQVIYLQRQPHSLQPSTTVSPETISQLESVYGDLRNYNLISRAVRDATPDVVLHLAAAGVSSPFIGPHEAIRNNVTGTVNLLRACFENKWLPDSPAKVIIGRTPGELEPSNTYAASKAASWKFCEMFVRSQGWPIIGAMIFQTYGVGQPDHMLIPGAIKAALRGSDYPTTTGKQARDWIHVSDVAQALTAISTSETAPGATIDIGTGIPTSVADVVNLIFSLTVSAGKPLIGKLPDRTGESDHPLADSVRTYDRIGWRTTLTLEEGLLKTIEKMSDSDP